MNQLDYFFYPKHIAVIGASGQPDSIGRAIFENFNSKLCIGDFCKEAYPVNPNHSTILGRKSYASIKDIEGSIDLAVIVVPAKAVPKVMRECVEKKVKAAIIISAGFSEIGEKKLTAELQAIIDNNPGTRVIGPNCFGLFVADTGLDTTFAEKQKMNLPRSGSVAFMSQSGALGIAVLDWMSTQEFGLSKFISYGNAMDVDEAELLDYLSKDSDTKVISIYIEGVKEGRKFMEIAKKTSMKKPVVVLKGGVTEETHSATASHTGSLAGSAQVYEALFRQTGIIQAHDLIELFVLSKILANAPLTKGKRVLIITNGGGYGIVTADQAIQNGLELASISKNNAEKLRKAFPETVTIRNPLDLVGDADEKRYKIALEAGLKEDNVDMIMVLVLFNTPAIDKHIVEEITRLRRKAKKPVIVVAIGSKYTAERKAELEKGGVVTFNYPFTAAVALKGLYDYSKFRKVAK